MTLNQVMCQLHPVCWDHLTTVNVDIERCLEDQKNRMTKNRLIDNKPGKLFPGKRKIRESSCSLNNEFGDYSI